MIFRKKKKKLQKKVMGDLYVKILINIEFLARLKNDFNNWEELVLKLAE